MTTVILRQLEDDVIIGFDGLATVGDNEAHDLVNPKVVVNGGVVIVVAGLARASSVLEFAELPEYDGQEARRWLSTVWYPKAKEALVEAGFNPDEGDFREFTLHVVVDCQAFRIDSLGHVSSFKDGLYATGSGGDYAKGAVLAGAKTLRALQIAAELDPHTGGELTVTTASELLRQAA